MAISPDRRELARHDSDANPDEATVGPSRTQPAHDPVVELDGDGPTIVLEPETPPSPSAAEGGLPGPLAWVARIGVVAYMALILGFIWLARDLTLATFTQDPIFAGYSIAVVTYVLGRFAIAPQLDEQPGQLGQMLGFRSALHCGLDQRNCLGSVAGFGRNDSQKEIACGTVGVSDGKFPGRSRGGRQVAAL